MALMKNGIPIKLDKDCRVKIDCSASEMWFKFGIYVPDMTTSQREMFSWIRENCTGYVYHVEYPLVVKKERRYIMEFFFKTVSDAIMFKMNFS